MVGVSLIELRILFGELGKEHMDQGLIHIALLMIGEHRWLCFAPSQLFCKLVNVDWFSV